MDTKKKSEMLRVRTTPGVKFQIDRLAGKHRGARFKSESDLISSGVNLLINDYTGLFANISENMAKIENFVPKSEKQYKQLIDADRSLRDAFRVLTETTDGYLPIESTPNEWKDTLRDFLIPVIENAIGKYENIHHIPDDERWTDPLDDTWDFSDSSK